MSRLEVSTAWKGAPEGEAFGPERPTWASLELKVDDVVLTKHGPDGPSPGILPEDAVEGPLSGLAEWIVDNLAYLLWEAHVPAPKLDANDEFQTLLPDLRAASNWWKDLTTGDDPGRLAAWQERHTFGVAASQIALPSLVFVPERSRVGLFVSPPPSKLNPSVRLHLESKQSEHWLERDDLRSSLSQLVDGAIERAVADQDSTHWANWLREKWTETRRRERSVEERRRLQFGETVARAWDRQIASLPEKGIIEGMLSDVTEINSDDQLSRLLSAVRVNQTKNNEGSAWKKLLAKPSSSTTQPYKEGYELARKVRRELGLGLEPIERMDMHLGNLDIQDHKVDTGGLFRAASCVQDRHAAVLVDQSVQGLTARRVALATAFGRLLFEATGKSWGAAFGAHSRVQETRRAGAFAAELLAPGEVVPKYFGNPQRLAEDYGISLASANWRIFNVNRNETQY